MRKPKAVLFDLFETLITEFECGTRISKRKYDYMELIGLSNEDFKREWGSRLEKRMTGFFPDFHALIEDIVSRRNLAFSKESADFLLQERLREKMIPFRNIRQDILDLLSTLRRQGVKIGLISNCTEEEVGAWGESKLADFFDDAVFSYKVGIAKPDERIYRLACERLSIGPEDAVFVGDGGSRELEGADTAGIRPYHAFWYNTFVESPFMKLRRPEELLHELRLRGSEDEGYGEHRHIEK